MNGRLIDISQKEHPDLYAFTFCAKILLKEIKKYKPHLTHILINKNYAYSTNGGTCRKAKLIGDYKDGMYRVFKKSKNEIILYLTDLNHMIEYPDIESLFNTEVLKQLQQIQISKNFWWGHATIIQIINAQETFDAKLLDDAEGVYDLYLNNRMIILDNQDFALTIMPLETQEQLPGM